MFRRATLILAAWSAVAGGPAYARVVIAAHRGLSSAALPENSLAAFREAVARGVEVIEIDLRSTADGQIVVMHDPNIDRMTDARGSVAGMSLARLKALDLGGGEHIPTLDEALAIVRGSPTRLLFDLKRGGDIPAATVMGAVVRADAMDRVIIGARSVGAVRAYRELAPTIEILGLIPQLSDVDGFAAAGAKAIRLWPRWIFAPTSGCGTGPRQDCLVQRLQRRGLAVWTTADASGDSGRAGRLFARLAKIGLDAILTNRPDLARSALPVSSPAPDPR